MMRFSTLGAPVKIPDVLIERLKPFGRPCFIKVETPTPGDEHSGKKAVEKGFQNNPYEVEDPSLQGHLQGGGNYGVLAGEGIIIVETDTKETTEKMAGTNTFTVQSGGGGWRRHFYILSNASENGVINDAEKRNLGNVQVERKYVVGPGCRHFTGNIYKIVNDAPIAYVSKERLEKIFGDNLSWAHQRRFEHEEQAEQEKIEGALIPLKDLINLSELQVRDDEYQGCHPIHGSLTGKNFCVNIKKNVWHCFRCNSGGGGLMWIAVKHGIIECSEAQKGALKGTKFLEALRIAREKYGFDVKVPDEELSPDVARFFEDGKFVPALTANELMKENRFLTQMGKEGKGLMFRYDRDNGIYQAGAEDYVNLRTRKKLGKHYTINREKEIEAFIKASTLQHIPETSRELIAVKNGVLNVFTRELKPFSPDYYVFNVLPTIYDVNAKCPKFDKFLPEVVPSEDDRRILQEHAGNCLLKDSRFQKALMLIGAKQNGKSTFLCVLTRALGEENVSAIPLQNLSDSSHRFTVGRLHNKIANICADLPPTPLRETDLFKKLVAGDMVTGEFKFKGEFDFIPYVKLFFSANLLPPLPKDVEAFIIRWNIINFPNSFLPGDLKRDPDLRSKLSTPEELSGVLNWMLNGLERLLSQNDFSKGGTTEEAEDRWSMSSDSQKAFVENELIATFKDFCHPEVEIEEEQQAVYTAYVNFCADHKLQAVSKRTFAKHMHEFIDCTSFRTSRIVDGEKKEVYLWRGIRFKKPEEKEEWREE